LPAAEQVDAVKTGFTVRLATRAELVYQIS